MPQILSDKEIEALQKALADEEIELDKADKKEISKKYDLIFQKRLTPKLSAILNVVFSRFIVNLRASLSLRLRRVIRTELLSFDYQKYTDLVDGLPTVCWIEIVEIQPFHGYCILVFNPDLALVLIDLLCGGNGKISFDKESFTSFAPLEQSLMRNIVKLTLSDLQTAWQSVTPEIKLISQGFEFNPQLLTGFSPDDSFTIIPIKVTIGDFSGNMAFCMPQYALEPLKEEFLGKEKEEKREVDPETMVKIMQNLLDTEVELSVVLAEKTLTLRDILNLEPNQVLDLNKSVDDEIVVRVEGVARFKGYPVQVKGNKAVKISETLLPFSLEGKEDERDNSQGKS